jgi:glycosyltransferase involved in cell wall biosynthesis
VDRARPERVVLAIDRLDIGGTEQQVVELALGLRRRGWDVHVAALAGPGAHDDALTRSGIAVYHGRLSDPRAAFRIGALATALGAPLAFWRYVRWLRRVRPTVVHGFLYKAYVPTVFAARRAHVPVVVTGRRSLSHFKRSRRLALRIERAANVRTDVVVANCDAVAVDAREYERLPADKVVVINNGVPERFFAVPIVEPSADLRILCVANFIPYKGHDVLLDAATTLAATGIAFTLSLVGDGPERASLEHRAEALGDRVVFLGTRTDIESLLAATDVVVSASHEEGLSNSVLEAMAAGRAVVATSVGGNPEALADTGLLVPDRDPAAMSAALATLARDPSKRAAMGMAARERARARFSVERMVDAHIALYARVVT